MTAPPPLARFLSSAAQERNGPTRGVWSLFGDTLLPLDDSASPVVLIPSEHVLMLAIDLPLGSHRARIEALPFAIEDRIAAPLGDTHLALGASVAPNKYLVGAVRHDLMRQWLAMADAAGLGQAAFVPDALTLPAPPAGRWAVQLANGRAMIRTGDGTGFAIAEAQLRTAWTAAGKPSCLVYGDPLPLDFAIETSQADVDPLERRLRTPALDLRQGVYGRRRTMSPLSRRIAIVAASGLLAHGAIAAADTIALRSIAGEREAETRNLLAIAAPGRPLGQDVVTVATDMLPAGNAPPGQFLPLLSRISAAAAPAGVGLRSLSFDAREGKVALEIVAESTEQIRRVENALSASGLQIRKGEPVEQDGMLRHVITVRDPAAEIGR